MKRKPVNENVATAFKMITVFKDAISELLLAEMKKRKMNKKEFASYVGLSFPTFAKLVKNPDAQSICTIKKVFDVLQNDNVI